MKGLAFFKKSFIISFVCFIGSVVEHFTRNEGVAGSNPAWSLSISLAGAFLISCLYDHFSLTQRYIKALFEGISISVFSPVIRLSLTPFPLPPNAFSSLLRIRISFFPSGSFSA